MNICPNLSKKLSAELDFIKWIPGANPTIVSYSASAVKIYNATNSLVRFENKNIFFNLKNALVYYKERWRCGYKL
jgi:hypothetical protein